MDIKMLTDEFEQFVEENKGNSTDNYIENNIIKFIQILRGLGFNISLVESIEAVDSLKTIDILNKKEFKLTLQALLVKNYEERKIYNQVFELFFTSEGLKNEKESVFVEDKDEISEDDEVIHDPIDRKDKEDNDSDDEDDEEWEIEIDNLDQEQQELYEELDPEVKEKVNEQVRDKFGETLLQASKTDSMVKNFIQGSLQYWKAKLNQNRQGIIDLDSTIDVRKTGDREVDSKLRSIVNKLDDESEFILAKDIKEIAEENLEETMEVIKRLSRKLATKFSRRQKKKNKSRKIDIRSTLRKNIKYGGTLVELSYQQRRRQKPRFLLICDVSDSMAKYSTFILQFIYGFSDVIKEIESFIFSEDLERITDYFEDNKSFGAKMSEIIGDSKEWSGATNLNQALETFNQEYESLLTSRTVVFIVSDTKTLGLEEAVQKVKSIKSKVKDIIWLNTLPKSAWENRDSVKLFKNHCQMFKCNRLKDMQQIIKKKLL
ncbi:VWA domain-containing protein [Acetohalobium arabaticum]|uniref:VWA containing CoxE family protein n=1 Tax=Acetohalobium arabaticum (strain ATCC 49924 / DSM 5501 / Z-7288) TaxID=574087 RepID=D9QQ81_ACEAZ|nr:VWA domain-containing protein [Acetohalobium arabaticum]ADL12672.1 VWA containing CoxE family protein [Acetohalobium arabaticum DSM 5501]